MRSKGAVHGSSRQFMADNARMQMTSRSAKGKRFLIRTCAEGADESAHQISSPTSCSIVFMSTVAPTHCSRRLPGPDVAQAATCRAEWRLECELAIFECYRGRHFLTRMAFPKVPP